MFTTILLTHRIVVSIFLLHYIVKFGLLAADRDENLASYTKITRVPEMIISLLFLLTGGYMLFKVSDFGMIMIFKLVCVFASIPLAVIGFKKKNKMLALLAVILILLAYGFAEMNKKSKTGGKVDTSAVGAEPVAVGKAVYLHSCVSCHGADGKLGLAGAKDLSVTQLSQADEKQIIKGGKNAMPGYNDLTDEQVDGVVQYIATLKQ